MKKNIVFDFDYTLTTFDTIYPFFKFCNQDNTTIKSFKKLYWFFLLFLHRINLISNYTLKDKGIKLFLRGHSKKYIKKKSLEFYEKITYYEQPLKDLESYLSFDDNVYISSASFYEYLTVFSDFYKNVNLSTSLLKYKNNNVMGLGFNNYGKNKMIYFDDIDIDILYTDSYSDRFLAKKAKKIIVVTKNGKMREFNNYNKFFNYFKNKGKIQI